MNNPWRLHGKDVVKTWLFNPFYFVAGSNALIVGLAIVVAAGVNSWFSRSHFDGVLDFHTGLVAPLWMHVAEGLVAWLTLGLISYVAGLLISKSRVRAVDVFGTQALARVPTLVIAAVAMLPGYQRQVSRLAMGNPQVIPEDIISFGVVAMCTLLMLVWMVLLMYRAFSVSCNVTGRKALISFAIAVLVGEVVSKVILIALMTCVTQAP